MSGLLKFFGVAALAAVDLFLAIPAGVAARYGFVELFAAMAVGGSIGAGLAVFFGDEASRWWAAHHKVRSRPKPTSWIHRIVERFGAPGLGLLGPVLVGAPAAAVLGIGFGIKRGPLLVWLVTGTVAWSAILAGLTSGGVAIVD